MEFTITIKSEWKELEGRYENGKGLFLGKVMVASVCYDGMRAKGDPNKYSVSSKMQGIKPNLGSFETEKEGIAKAEYAMKHWIEKFLKS